MTSFFQLLSFTQYFHSPVFFTVLFLAGFQFCSAQIGSTPCPFDYKESYIPTCGYNHRDSIIPILYGKPTAKSIHRAKRGEIYLAGCFVTDCDPRYYCRIHKTKF